jgi:hypothetical protein
MSEGNRDDLKITMDEIRKQIERDKAEKKRKDFSENLGIALLTLFFLLTIFIAATL